MSTETKRNEKLIAYLETPMTLHLGGHLITLPAYTEVFTTENEARNFNLLQVNLVHDEQHLEAGTVFTARRSNLLIP